MEHVLLTVAQEAGNPFILSDDAAEKNIEKFKAVRGALNAGYQVWCYPFTDSEDLYTIDEVWLDPRDHIHVRAVDSSLPEILLDQVKVKFEPTYDGGDEYRPRRGHTGYVAYADAYTEYVNEDGEDNEEEEW